MPPRVQALVKPELLIWARESARLDQGDAAEKAHVFLEQLRAWESGEDRPSIPQLRKVAHAYKRPLAVFYLSKAHRHFQAMHGFRRRAVPERPAPLSPQLAFEIRRARERREIALDLLSDLGEPRPAFALAGGLEEDPEAIADRLRNHLGVGADEATHWRDGYAALKRWRDALEQHGVLVFQARGVRLDEMRAFSIGDTALPVIVVNTEDSPAARVFSLLHEAAHLMLREGGLCDLGEEGTPSTRRIEVFCNHVAGATLVPKRRLLSEPEVKALRGVAWSASVIEALSKRYRVNRETLLRRLLILGQTTEQFYRKKREELRAEYEERERELLGRKALGLAPKPIVTPDRIAVGTVGTRFARLVLSSYYQEKISSSDLASFLDIRLKHIPKVEQAVFGRKASA